MIFRALDANGDFAFGRGKQSYFYRQDALYADIRTALLLFLRDAFWDVNSGVDWWTLCSGKQPQAELDLLFQTRKVLLSRKGVVQVNWVQSQFDRGARKLFVQYDIDTVFSGRLNDVIDADPFAFTDNLGNFLINNDGAYLVPYHA
jgi:hypothetical protein